jgi:hypothetical protein
MVLCACAVALWWRSSRRWDCISYVVKHQSDDVWSVDPYPAYSLISVPSSLNITRQIPVIWQTQATCPKRGFLFHSEPTPTGIFTLDESGTLTSALMLDPSPNHRFMSFGWGLCDAKAELRMPSSATLWVLSIPYWFLTVFFGAYPIGRICLSLRRRQRFNLGKCEACGYDLRATPGRCPECGTAPSRPAISI